ncbi:RDD family protein [Nonomuraea sp. NBC_01738]|uniref:RDD family protein n=1 Tax=Nonomuraea sp. NBC_01738 TaxID=2976003 RepID=UPI002E0D89E4|nr:RDD family protein [Nonomuraea sp. NBC_01738]
MTPGPAQPPAPVPAEWWDRLVARLIEALVFGVFYYILAILLWSFCRSVGLLEVYGGRLPEVFAWFLTGLGYTAYEWTALSRSGRTFGKAIMRIRVTGFGGAVTGAGLLKRALLYPGPVMLMGIPVANPLAGMLVFALGLLILINRPLLRGPADRVAGTRVVKDPGRPA